MNKMDSEDKCVPHSDGFPGHESDSPHDLLVGIAADILEMGSPRSWRANADALDEEAET